MERIEIMKSMIELKRPLVFMDLETTGLDTASDRIVSMSFVKISPDWTTLEKHGLVNPGVPIEKAATDIHGITNEMVRDMPTFRQLAKSLYEWLSDCDMAGYNINNFDRHVLFEEFFRTGIIYPGDDVEFIDMCTIFQMREPRDLTNALKFYCNKKMKNAHNSKDDTYAAMEVFAGQMNKYKDMRGKSVAELAAISKRHPRAIDWAGNVIKDEQGEYIYNFGKKKGTRIRDNVNIAHWALEVDFPRQTKTVLREVLAEIEKKKARGEYRE